MTRFSFLYGHWVMVMILLLTPSPPMFFIFLGWGDSEGKQIAVDNSTDLLICGNQLTDMGYAMRFEGDCQTTRLKNNVMTEYNEGIWLENAKFSLQGLPTPLPDGTGWDNQWIHTDPIHHLKVDGSLNVPGQIEWYHQGADNSSNEFSPNPYLSVLVLPRPLAASGAIDCETALRLNDDFNRDSVFGPVVGDTAVYISYEDESSYLARADLFKRLSEDPSLLTTGSDADESFTDFYEDMLATNVGKFDSVNVALRSSDLATADDINNRISDDNDIELNIKTINDLVVNKILVDSILNSTDTATLESIFIQHWLVAGNGVYSAAAILFEEYYSPSLALRLMQPSQQQHLKENDINNVLIYPNPVKDKLFITGIAGESNTIEIYDCYSRILYRKTGVASNKIIDVSHFVNGIYNLRIINGEESYKTRFILLK